VNALEEIVSVMGPPLARELRPETPSRHAQDAATRISTPFDEPAIAVLLAGTGTARPKLARPGPERKSALASNEAPPQAVET
jgi:hypothetical protein